MRIGAILGGLILLLTAFAGPAAAGDPVAARLVPEAASIAPGHTLWVDLHLDIAPGWHTYWRNPGDSGLPTEVKWTLPAGFSAGDIAWPIPERFVQGKIGNYGYSGTADLLVPLKAPTGLKPGKPVEIGADTSWLVCSEICIPGSAKLHLSLPVGNDAPDPATAPLFAATRAKLPHPAGFAARFSVGKKDLRLLLPADLETAGAAFFPIDPNAVDAAAPIRVERQADGTMLVLPRATGPTAVLPAALHGVLVVKGKDGAPHGFTLTAPRIAAPVDDEGSGAAIGWWQALLLAFAGGVILNLMPCVFPVLSLKLLGLAQSAHRGEERRHAVAYAAGVILSFAALGGLLLALRGAGAAIGWGFQLQSPLVVALLAYLLFAMGLSLSGVAEFGLGLAGIGGRFAERSGIAGAFATGVLATVVATPCTAPFMGAALGFALVAPTALALAVFVALGCGLAAPMLLAGVLPVLSRWLPRPGPWMGWFKQVLAFPLYGTVAWLVWVLIQEVGPSGAFLALVGLVAIGFAMWVYGRTRIAARRVGAGLATLAAAAAFVIAATLRPAAPTAGSIAEASFYQKFTAARLSHLEAEHHPVFVNLTAAWCITCLVNEHTTLADPAVRRAFAAHGVVALKGDWTRQDPDITAFLRKFNRSGVPLYLLYDKTGAATVLPQILTEAAVLRAVAKI